MEGRVMINGSLIDKQGVLVSLDSKTEIIEKMSYVSRGGLKIEGIFKDLGLDVSGKLAADIGSSTGGFTDFLIQRGAARVVSIDVGYGLLDWKLRNSEKVDLLEKTNIRYLDLKKLPYKTDITVVDVSFISIKKIIEKILKLTVPDGEILLLFKPQFELDKKDIANKKGIIRNPELHFRGLNEMINYLKDQPVTILDIKLSKIKGAKGNIEFWIYLKNSKTFTESELNYDKIIQGAVDEAHLFFKKKQ
jgi:23S rRNA (cytidine1920-2'-O)/16S rRNA (cytidine1409-2'-O)-methyltransferase